MANASLKLRVASIGRDGRWVRARTFALATLWVLIALVYWPGLGGGYVFDDFPNIVDNAALHITGNATWNQWLAAAFSSPSSELQRPVAMLSFAINHALTGLDPYWMKLTNLAIHLLNSWLVFNLVRCILKLHDPHTSNRGNVRTDWVAVWVAAVWALHPINLMAVLFVVQRMESLSHTFVFAGLWLYVIGRVQLRNKGQGWSILVMGLVGGTLLGALVKESAALLPLYAFALEWVLLGFASRDSPRDYKLIWLYVVVLLLPAVVGMMWLLPNLLHGDVYPGRNFTPLERLLTEGRVLLDYLHWTLLPDLSQLSLYHDDYQPSQTLVSPLTTLWSLLLLLGLFAAMLWLRKRRPVMGLGLAWFFCAHLLTATVVPLELMFEHRNYFASLGICLALADGLLMATSKEIWRRTGVIFAAAFLLLCTMITGLRAREWQDPLAFSLIERAKHPQSPRATYDVARNFILLSEYQPGSRYIPKALTALDQAMQVPNATTLPETAAIILAGRTNSTIYPSWWLSLQRKLRSDPIGPQQTSSLGRLVDCGMRPDCHLPPQDMVETFSSALARGSNAEVLSIYGNYALNVLHNPSFALRMWQDAVQLEPEVVQYQATLARMLIASGRVDEAYGYIQSVRRLGRLGQNDVIADELALLANQAMRTQIRPAHADRQPDQKPEY